MGHFADGYRGPAYVTIDAPGRKHPFQPPHALLGISSNFSPSFSPQPNAAFQVLSASLSQNAVTAALPRGAGSELRCKLGADFLPPLALGSLSASSLSRFLSPADYLRFIVYSPRWLHP